MSPTLLLALALAAGPKPEANGSLAVPVKFPEAAAEKLAATSLELLATSGAISAAKEEGFVGARRGCHVRIKLGMKRKVDVNGKPVEIDELILVFPLTGIGGIYARAGDDYYYFAKYPSEGCSRIQALLAEAKPDGL